MVDYRLSKVAALVPVHGRWLDCGTCDGEYAARLPDYGAREVIGIDVDPERVARAEERWRGAAEVTFEAAAGEKLPYPDAYFDGVLLNEVLEHVDDQCRTLAEVHRVLAPGGVLALFSPNRWFPFEGHGMVVGRHNIGVPVPLLPWLPRGLGQRVMKARNYWPGELRGLVEQAGLSVRHVGFAFPLFGHYPWLPAGVIRWYRSRLARFEASRVAGRFGVSTLVVATRS